MKNKYFETFVGLLVIAIAIFFSLFMYKIGNKNKAKDYNSFYALFDNIEGVSVYSKIKIGGLEVGEVAEVKINDNYKIQLKLNINKDIKVPVDSMIKITTSGLIGSKYLKLEIGGEEETLSDGDYFEFTQSTMDLEDMITRFILNKANTTNNKK